MPPEDLPTRTHEAYTALKRRIIDLTLPPGASFSEGELAMELGFSKTPVREALARLRQERLVEAVARSGYRVTPVTVKGAHDLFQLRALLEGEAAAIAADRGGEIDTLLELDDLCRASYDPDDQSSISAFLEANTRFHVTVAMIGGNDALAMMLQQVLEQLERLFHLGLALNSRGHEMVHEHQELLAAVKSGDPEAARRAATVQTGSSQLMVLNALLSSDSVVSANIVAADG
jgi:DNA-binding GntR family transcriptional regulator